MPIQRRAMPPRVAIATGVLVLVMLGAWLLPPLLIPPGRAVGWERLASQISYLVRDGKV